MPHRSYEFVQLDVFTQTPLTGNPLAIFTDARRLDDGEMQALAREMNLSETTFILPRDPATEAQEGKKSASSRSRKNCRLPDIRRSARRCICMPRVFLPFPKSRMRSYS